MRLVEHKKDVVILMDSITRLARAYNLVVPPPAGRYPVVLILRPFIGLNVSSGPPVTLKKAAA